MKFTLNAINYIKSEYNDEINGIIININKSCCVIGEDIKIAFARLDNDYEIIDGIKVKYDKLDKKYLDDLVIDYKNSMIIFEES